MTEFYMHQYLPFLPVAPRIALVMVFQLFVNLKPHPSQMRFVRLNVHFEEQKVAGRASLIAGLEYGMERWNGLRMRITH